MPNIIVTSGGFNTINNYVSQDNIELFKKSLNFDESSKSLTSLERTANGIDYNRLSVLIAVLEKKVGLNLGNQDVYLNVVSGLKINEPAIDLGIIAATVSSFKNIPIDTEIVVLGEVGLTGEVRSINLIEKRIKEAEKLGFKKCIIPESNKKLLKENFKLDIIGVKNIIDAMKYLGLK